MPLYMCVWNLDVTLVYARNKLHACEILDELGPAEEWQLITLSEDDGIYIDMKRTAVPESDCSYHEGEPPLKRLVARETPFPDYFRPDDVLDPETTLGKKADKIRRRIHSLRDEKKDRGFVADDLGLSDTLARARGLIQ